MVSFITIHFCLKKGTVNSKNQRPVKNLVWSVTDLVMSVRRELTESMYKPISSYIRLFFGSKDENPHSYESTRPTVWFFRRVEYIHTRCPSFTTTTGRIVY